MFSTETPLFVETNNLFCCRFQFRMCENDENRMSWRINSRNNQTNGSGTQIHAYIRRKVEQGSCRIWNVQDEEVDHQLHSTYMSFSLGIPKASGVSLHPLYMSPQGMY
jgi:hypothetical protein